jgi:flagellar capping protein FliD
MKNSLIVIAFLLGGALLYSVYVSRNLTTKANSTIDSVLNVYEAQKVRIGLDSIKYSNAIDSLSNQIKTIEKQRANELYRLKSKYSKIRIITNNSEFNTINDSLEKCCSM